MEGFLGETEEERVAIVQPRSDQTVNKDGSGVRGERGPETVNIAVVEISSAGDVIYMRVCCRG